MLKHYVGLDRLTEKEVQGDIMKLEDSEGRTWKDLMFTFRKDTWKVGYTQHGVILSLQQDTRHSNIGGCYGVCEVESLPEEYDRAENYKWYFNTETCQVERDPLMYEYMKNKRIEQAVNKVKEHELLESMRPASRSAMLMAMPGPVEPTDHALWMNYLFDLQFVDTSLMEDIKWPDKPE